MSALHERYYRRVALKISCTLLLPGFLSHCSALILSTPPSAASTADCTLSPFAGGTGSPQDPYYICTPAQFNLIGADPDLWTKSFRLARSLDFVDTELKVIGEFNSWNDYHGYSGTFDGNSFSLSNIAVSSAGTFGNALFRVLSNSGVLKNLSIHSPTVSGNNWVGGLVGINVGGSVENCHVVSGAILSTLDGGIGGLVGISVGGSILKSSSSANVQAADSENASSGGLIGEVGENTRISESFATGSVAGVSTSAGGLIGFISGPVTLENSYATGSVSATDRAGGLIGLVSDGGAVISHCFSTGAVSGSTRMGGLIGDLFSGTVTASFWDAESSAQATSSGGVGLSTAQFFDGANHFSGWDQALWSFSTSRYPKLLNNL